MTIDKMKAKTFGLFVLSIFALVLVMGFGSAATIFSDDFNDGDLNGWTVQPSNSWTNTSTLKYAQSNSTAPDGSKNLSRTISTSGFETIVVKYDRQLFGVFESTDNFTVSWSADGVNFNVLENTIQNSTTFESKTFNLPSSANNNSNFQIKFECTTNANDEFCRVDNLLIEGTALPVTPSEITACNATGIPSDMDVKVKKIDFTNNGIVNGPSSTTFGDDNSWYPFEEIEVKIEIKNYGSYDANNVEVAWGLYDTKAKEWVIEPDTEKDFRLKHGDTQTLTVSFKLDDNMDIDLSDLVDGTHYKFYVTATGDIDDSDSAHDGESFCVFDSEDSEIVIERDFVVLDNIKIPESVQCGQTVEVTADAWNIGDHDQEDVSLEIYDQGNALKIANDVTIGDIDAFDKQVVSFTFTVPSGAEEKYYSLVFQMKDEDGNVYQSSNDDDSEFTVPFEVKGNCAVGSGVLISASLESEAKAGKEMVINVLLTNTANTTRSFTMEASGYDAWAKLSESPAPLLLNAGNAGEALFKFYIEKGISGEQTFSILVYLDNKLITTQPVSVNVEPASFLGITGLVTSSNAYLWGIGLLNVILIIIIIIMAVRIARRK